MDSVAGVRLLRFCLSLLTILPYSVHIKACYYGDCKLGDRCSENSNCAPGLYCSSCVADKEYFLTCHRSQASNVTAIRNDLPFNKYSWLTTHNSFAIVGEPSYTGVRRITFENQEDSVTDQLNNGVRGLMLDMYDFMGDVWLCHSFGGICTIYTAFKPAIDTLNEIEAFLSRNPSEVVTIFIEDYVYAPEGLTRVFKAAGLKKYWFPVSQMPRNGKDWPILAHMIARNHRLIVFTSIRSKEVDEGIAYQWRYVNENQYGDEGMQVEKCSRRSESASLDTREQSLILVNFFPTNPQELESCKFNSHMLWQKVQTCYEAAGNRWENYIAVDFYKKSSGGGAFQAVDTLNAQFICGSSDLMLCKIPPSFPLSHSSLIA